MNIAVLGPGAMGSIFAAHFAKAGHSVTLIARGQRLNVLKTDGLWLQPRGARSATKVDGVKVSDTLRADDRYDLVLVTVQRSQIDSLIPVLAASTSKKILLMLNCASDVSRWNAELGAERVFWGFPSALGDVVDKVTHYFLLPGFLRFLQITTLGRINAPIDPPLKEIESLFHGAGLPATCTNHMDTWLLTHAAFMAPLMAAGYIHPDKQTRFHFTLAEARLISSAIKENFTSLRRLKIKPTPLNMRILGSVPQVLFFPSLWLIFASTFAKQAVFGHAGHAAAEADLLFQELEALAGKTGLQIPAMRKLHIYIPSTTRR